MCLLVCVYALLNIVLQWRGKVKPKWKERFDNALHIGLFCVCWFSPIFMHRMMTIACECVGITVDCFSFFCWILQSNILQIGCSPLPIRRVPSIWAGGAANSLQKHSLKKNSSSVNHCSKFIFNNVIDSLTIYSFCRLSDYFWSVDIKLMVAILVEFNVSCNVGRRSSTIASLRIFLA